jgi:Flp pilus assembly pilin Flp
LFCLCFLNGLLFNNTEGVMPSFFRKKPNGKAAALTEYGVVGGLVAVVGIGAVFQTGDTTKTVFCKANDAIVSALGWGDPACLASVPPNPDGGSGSPDGGGSPPNGNTIDYDGMILTGEVFPAGTIGQRTEMIPLPVGHPGGQLWELSGAVQGVELCYAVQEVLTCGSSLTLPSSAGSIGWRAQLPVDTYAVFAQTFTATLSMDGDVLRGWPGLLVERLLPQEEDDWMVVATTFPDVVHPEGTYGVYTHMQPLSGTLASVLRLYAADGEIMPCVQAVADGAVSCGAVGGAIDVSPNAYAIGYRANDLPEDPRVEYASYQSLQLVNMQDTDDVVEWGIRRSRTATPIVLAWNQPAPVVLPQGALGVQDIQFPFSGEANGPMRLAFTPGIPDGSPDWSGAYQVCVWETVSSDPTCTGLNPSASAIGTLRVNPTTHAFGFRLASNALPTNLKAPWGGDTQVILSSILDTSITETKTLVASREQEPIVFEPSLDVSGTTWRSIHPARSTTVTNMVQLTGTFNDPLTLRRTGAGITQPQLCVQATSSSSINCTTSLSISVPATAHAVGVRHTFTAGSTYATTDTPTLILEATNDTTQNVSWSARMERLPEVVPSAQRNLVIPVSETSLYNSPNWTQLFRNGANGRARITVSGVSGGARVALCTHSNGSSTSYAIMCSPYLASVGNTATRSFGTSERVWLSVNGLSAAGAKDIQVNLEVWSADVPTTSLQTYPITIHRD